jgi:predicted nucleic acid-binding protein
MVAERYSLDTNILIDTFEPKKPDETHDKPRFEPLALKLQLLLASSLDRDLFVAGDMTYTEILVQPIRENNRTLIESYTLLFESGRLWTHGRLNLDVLFLAAQIRATSQSKINTPDALQLATAYDHKCTHFLTRDKGIPHGAFEFTNARFENLKHGEWFMDVLAPDIDYVNSILQKLS